MENLLNIAKILSRSYEVFFFTLTDIEVYCKGVMETRFSHLVIRDVTFSVHFKGKWYVMFGRRRRRNIFYKQSKRKIKQAFLTAQKHKYAEANVILVKC